MSIKHVLIDGDIIMNKAAFSVERRLYSVYKNDAPIGTFKTKIDARKYCYTHNGDDIRLRKEVFSPFTSINIIDDLLLKIMYITGASSSTIVIGPPSGSSIFRHRVASPVPYKGDRNKEDRPICLPLCREYLLEKYEPVVAEDMEADDVLGILQGESNDTIIASIDKDLLQIPGYHYNIDKRYITISTDPGHLFLVKNLKKGKVCWDITGYGFKWFCAQMLLGDKVDNIPKPQKGLGPKKIYNMFLGKDTPDKMWKVVESVYKESELNIESNATLLWILRNRHGDWRQML